MRVDVPRGKGLHVDRAQNSNQRPSLDPPLTALAVTLRLVDTTVSRWYMLL